METAIAIMAVTFLGEVATLKILMLWFLVMHRSSYHNTVCPFEASEKVLWL